MHPAPGKLRKAHARRYSICHLLFFDELKIHANLVHSFYAAQNVLALEKLKRGYQVNKYGPANRAQQSPAKVIGLSSVSGMSTLLAVNLSKAPARMHFNDEVEPIMDKEGDFNGTPTRSQARASAAWTLRQNEKNKENRPLTGRGKGPARAPAMYDQKPGSKRLEWEEYPLKSSNQHSYYRDANTGEPSRRKRQHEETGESEDEGFQSDRRIHDIYPKERSSVPEKPSIKKSRLTVSSSLIPSAQIEDTDELQRINQVRAQSVLQLSPREFGEDVDGDDELEQHRRRARTKGTERRRAKGMVEASEDDEELGERRNQARAVSVPRQTARKTGEIVEDGDDADYDYDDVAAAAADDDSDDADDDELDELEELEKRRNRERAHNVIRRRARRMAEGDEDDYEDDEDNEEEGEGEGQSSTIKEFMRARKLALDRSRDHMIQTKGGSRQGPRCAWSLEDTGHLIELIEKYGCQWSAIQKRSKFQDRVLPEGLKGQVVLKDKARNIKLQYLK